MTLTRILPSLRRSIPDPISSDHWPAATVATISDVIVDGVSLLRVVELCGTPAVHLGPASVPGTAGHLASAAEHSGVIVVRVVEASAHLGRNASGNNSSSRTGASSASGTGLGSARSGERSAVLDADLSALAPVWAEARLIGRTSVARVTPTTLTSQASGCSAPAPVALPGDLRAGDLLALPYATVTHDAGIARKRSHDVREIALTGEPAT
ncbi:hypothetical protein [Agromyces sp. CCNWLW203]|uniref:hypothetical protein n=1 Tax=Agromyces sp. CCNWLW203 TaxID=3112842 RepID=UPI002F965546